jgi:uncharacterized repeat protein (TIGR01451 family)
MACLVVASVLAAVGGGSAASAASRAITSAGPLTRIEISDTLNCSVNHVSDASGEFFGDTACGTFLAVGGTIYGPAEIPAGGDVTGAPNYVPFTPVSQSAVTGAGTASDPFRIVTVVDAGASGFRVTETDTYVVGQETYRTDVTVANSGATREIVLYRAGDCFLQDSDTGFGAVDAATGSVSCVGVTPQDTPGTRIEQWRPLTPGSRYIEAVYSEVWAAIATGQPFPNTCRCAENIDNGAGLSWSATVPGGGSVTFSHLTSFSPAGNQPLTTTKTADAATVAPGATTGYTIRIANPNTSAVTVNSVTDTLPAGFTYVAGSTTGATTANPSVSGQVLTWSGPFTVPAGGSVELHFRVTASSSPGTYTNSAGAEAANYAVVPTGDTAAITVGGTGGTSSTTSTTATTSTTVGSSSTTTTTSSSATTTAGSATTTTVVATGQGQGTVTPGAFCSPAGVTGVTVTGLPMVCSTTAQDSQLRWREAGAAGQGTGSGATTSTTRGNPLANTGSDVDDLTMGAALLLGAGGTLLLVGGPAPAPSGLRRATPRGAKRGRWHNAAVDGSRTSPRPRPRGRGPAAPGGRR